LKRKTWLIVIVIIVVSTALSVFVSSYSTSKIDPMTQIVLPAIVSAVSTAVPLYIGIVLGIPKEIDVVMDSLEARLSKSPTAQRAKRFLELSDKMFGDDQAIAQVTSFFREARELVSSPEAKNFFKNATELMKQFTSKEAPTQPLITMPMKPKTTTTERGTNGS